MSIQSISSNVPTVVATTVEEMVGFAAIDSSDEAADASTELRHLGRSLVSQAKQQEVADQRRAADQDLIGGIARGVGQIVAGALSIAGGAHGLSAAGNTPTGSDVARQEYASRIGHEVGIIKSSGDLGRAGADIGAAVASRDAAFSRTRATEQEEAASVGEDVVQQARGDADEARATADRATDALQQLIEEKRRAMDAATRA
ncbi:MAG: hypothetical protein J0L92_16825 [Deltaproteobacteria bacterium]|nr:hypothetical protein [Deltaproteobacteria bacterium]